MGTSAWDTPTPAPRKSKRIHDRFQQSALLPPPTSNTSMQVPSFELGSKSKAAKRSLECEPTTTPLSGAPNTQASSAPERLLKRRCRMGGVSLLKKEPFGPVARGNSMQWAHNDSAGRASQQAQWPYTFRQHPRAYCNLFPRTSSSSPGFAQTLSPSSSSLLNVKPREKLFPSASWGNPKLQQQSDSSNQMDLIKNASRAHPWYWDDSNKSHECIVSHDKLEVCFHPECSESAAAIIGSRPLKRNGNYYYWEVTVFDKTYGTSVMFGVCTKKQDMHANDYCNLIGLDKNGWSMSHKGTIWHNGRSAVYTKTFPSKTVTVGLLFNTMSGELHYFMDGVNLGLAFCGLNDIKEDLYPVVGSTAKCTRMKLTGSYCGYETLLERTCFSILNNFSDKLNIIEYLEEQRIPKNLVSHLAKFAEAVCGSQTKNKTDQSNQCISFRNQRAIKD